MGSELTGEQEVSGNLSKWLCSMFAFLTHTRLPWQIKAWRLFDQKAKLKRSTYSNTAEQRRASFNPFIATCDAVLDNNAESYIKRLASHLSNKWNTSLPRVTGWLRARIQICMAQGRNGEEQD